MSLSTQLSAHQRLDDAEYQRMMLFFPFQIKTDLEKFLPRELATIVINYMLYKDPQTPLEFNAAVEVACQSRSLQTVKDLWKFQIDFPKLGLKAPERRNLLQDAVERRDIELLGALQPYKKDDLDYDDIIAEVTYKEDDWQLTQLLPSEPCCSTTRCCSIQ